ncbi:MAG: hypothetical protein KGL95_12190, partial [Patescibacteria group bacterium]|nr:hypothetical protein [Patescibacteria group bacterium]
MKKILLLLSLVLLLVGAVILVPRILADEQSDCQQIIQQCTTYTDECNAKLNSCSQSLSDALQMSQRASAPLQSQLDSMKQQLAQIQQAVANIEADLSLKKKQIDDGYKDIAQKEIILNAKIRDLYIKNYFDSPLTLFLSSKSATDWTRQLAYQKAVADQDKLVIT